MACSYCRSVVVASCPVCTVKPVNRVLTKAAVSPVVKPAAQALPAPIQLATVAQRPAQSAEDRSTAVTVREMPAVQVPAPAPAAPVVKYGGEHAYPWADDCAQAWKAGQEGVAVALAAMNADPTLAKLRCEVLIWIDRNAALRGGYITDYDVMTRATMCRDVMAECVAIYGFDPRYTRPLQPQPKLHLAPAAVQQARAALPKLTPMDWEELNRRVKAGAMSHGEAVQVKAEWDAMIQATDDILADLVKLKA